MYMAVHGLKYTMRCIGEHLFSVYPLTWKTRNHPPLPSNEVDPASI